MSEEQRQQHHYKISQIYPLNNTLYQILTITPELVQRRHPLPSSLPPSWNTPSTPLQRVGRCTAVLFAAAVEQTRSRGESAASQGRREEEGEPSRSAAASSVASCAAEGPVPVRSVAVQPFLRARCRRGEESEAVELAGKKEEVIVTAPKQSLPSSRSSAAPEAVAVGKPSRSERESSRGLEPLSFGSTPVSAAVYASSATAAPSGFGFLLISTLGVRRALMQEQ
ncbi:hypothetical protein Ahy_B08g092954 isoform A [Arachis hypogaea]|uniref:Uncharacterized protein n=1 Tax=Arachis hypogaea TaxID=3818 RepID=A0A444Y518_ARAHY|nr:hypothetical protein Ahy_B08g092954 isoform A [Arachis hypogaea]